MSIAKNTKPYLVIVMGVSGSGKTSIAKALAKEYEVSFMEADDFHSDAAKNHMASGQPLTDAMREPWIERMLAALRKGYENNKSYVLSYSGLKAAHRQLFRELPFSPKITFLMLDGEKDMIEKRMKERSNHFMPTTLLSSQFDTLERPSNESDVLVVPIHHAFSSVLKISKELLSKRSI